MKPAPFEYTLAGSIEEAVRALAEGAGEAIVLAGGQTLVPMLNMRMARPERVVDINAVADLAGIEEAPGEVTVKACTRQAAALDSDIVRARVPLLAKAIAFVGHAQTRNRGTVGGSLAHADPAAEIPLAALAMDAEVSLRSVGGARRVAVGDFLVGPLETSREPDELLVALHFPVPTADAMAGTAFHETSERHGDFAVVAVAARIELDGDGLCTDAAIAFGGVDARPLRIAALESRLLGTAIDGAAIADAVAEIAGAIDPASDQHAGAGYRRRVAERLASRAITEAVEDAQGRAA